MDVSTDDLEGIGKPSALNEFDWKRQGREIEDFVEVEHSEWERKVIHSKLRHLENPLEEK
jgi:hypothetical protein